MLDMGTGKYIRKAFSMFLDNPIIVVPFLLLGVLGIGLMTFAENYLSFNLGSINVEGVDAILLSGEILSFITQTLVNFVLILLVSLVFFAIIGSFVKAYSIGLVKQMASNKTAGFRDGLVTLDRGIQIFGMRIILIILGIAGFFILMVPATIIFGTIGAIFSSFLFLIYLIALMAIAFFAPQSIVLEKKGPLEGIIGSYKFLRKNLEGVVILIIFMLLLFVCFAIILKASNLMGSYLFSETALDFFIQGIRLILYSLILAPYFIIIKTYYFIKNKG